MTYDPNIEFFKSTFIPSVEVAELEKKISVLEERVKKLEYKLSYAEFLAGLSSPVDIIVCSGSILVDKIAGMLIARKKKIKNG